MNSELPTNRPEIGFGRWVHATQPKTFHLGDVVPGAPTPSFTGSPHLGSWFYATLAGTALIGIEHVPEPATGMMVIGGVGAMLMGIRSRRRRQS